MTNTNPLAHLFPKRDPSDPEDKVWYPGDDRSYPDQPPELLDGWELDLVVTDHTQLTNGACVCGWCAYMEHPAYYETASKPADGPR
jgi:hypothetical protein